MARMTKAQREELERRQRLAAMEQWLNTPGRHIEEWPATHAPEGMFAGVEGGVTSTASPFEPTAPVEAEEEELSPEQRIVREQLMRELGLSGADPDPALVDSALGLAGMLSNVAGVGLDALSPDPHVLDPSTFGPAGGHSGLASTAQHLADVALEIPGAARGILEWAGLENASRSLGIHGLLEAAEGRAGETIEERERRAQAVAEARQEAGLPTIEDLRSRSPFNQAADALYGFGENLRGYTSPELKAAQEGLGQSMEDGLGSTLGYLASGPGMRALATGVIPESAAYAVPQMAVSRAASLLGTGPRLAQGAANTMTAYTVAQQNAREVTDGIMSLSPEEALQLPDVAAEFERVGNIDVAKSTVANRARLTALAGGVLTSPLYGIDSFSRMGAGVAQRATATMPVRALTVGGRESLGEFGQEGMEAVVGDLGRLRAGQISRDEVGDTALPQAALGVVGSAPIAVGTEVGRSISEFDARARRLEEAAERLEALYADRQANQDAVDVAQANQRTAPDPSRADPEDSVSLDVDPLPPSELRTTEQVAADEAARLALSGIPVPERSPQVLSATRPLDRDAEEIVNRRLLALGPENEAEQEAWRTFMSVPAGRDLENRPLRGEGGRFTGERFGDNLNQLARDERGRLQGGTVRDRMRPRQPSAEELSADAQRLADSLVAEQQVEAEAADAQITRDRQLQEAREFDQREQERGDKEANKRLATAKGQHTRNRRAHLGRVREANMHLDPDARAEAIADAAAEWDAANPRPTLETLAPEAPKAPRAPRGRDARRPALTPEELAEVGLEPEDVGAAPTEEEVDVEADLRARYGRAQEGGETPAGRSAAEVVRELASRVRRGTDKSALEAESLLTGGKLSIVDPEVMAAVAGATESTEGYYDGERMYINAASLPAGDTVGVLFDSVLAHEANHAATASQNPDAVSKARVLLEDAPRRKLIGQLETANHPTAIAAREAVAARKIDKEKDPSRYEDEIIAYAINHAIESGGRSWAPIRGIVSAARRKMKEYTGSDNLNLDDLGYYARATVNALAESEAGINAPGVGREQIAMHGTPATFAPEEGAPLGRMRSDKALTGEGAQAYGAGHYLTQQWDTAENRYRTRLSEDRGAQPSREKALAEAIESSRWAVESPSDLTAEDVVDRLRYLDQHWTSERNRMQSVVDNSADALDRGYYETRVAEIDEDLAAIRSALELAENSDLRQMMEMADDSRDGDAGEVYYADIPEDSEMMHWQEPVSARSQELQDALLSIDPDANLEQPFASWYIQRSQSKGLGRVAGDRAVSDELAAVGIKGHTFSGRMDGDRNFVIYSDDDVSIGGRDRRELGEARREMEAFGEEIQSRPTSSRTLREEFEAEARERAAADRAARPRTELELAPFEGRAQEPVGPEQDPPREASFGPTALTRAAANVAKDTITWHGRGGKRMGDLIDHNAGIRDDYYSRALSNAYAAEGGIRDLAPRWARENGVSVAEARDQIGKMLTDRFDIISRLPTLPAREKALSRLVQQYPELSPVRDAVNDVTSLTEQIIEQRLRDPSPLNKQEKELYAYLDRNRGAYITNAFALFQQGSGKKWGKNLAKLAHEGFSRLAKDPEAALPSHIKNAYTVYKQALDFVVANDVAINDPEQILAMSDVDVRRAHDMWAPRGDSAADLKARMEEAGTFTEKGFKEVLGNRLMEWVNSATATPEGRAQIENHGHAVINAMLKLQPVPGAARRYARGGGVDDSILKHVKDLPEPIANLYGKIRDIPSLLSLTAIRQGELAARLSLFNDLQGERGRNGELVAVTAQERAANPTLYDMHTQQLSEGNYGALQDMYVTPETAATLDEYNNTFSSLMETFAEVGVSNPVTKALDATGRAAELTLGKTNKAYKTMAIPTRLDHLFINAVGSLVTPFMAGGVKPAHLQRGLAVAKAQIISTLDPTRRIKGWQASPEAERDRRLALQMGVMDNVVLSDIRRHPQKLVDQFVDDMMKAGTIGEMKASMHKLARQGGRGWRTWVEAFSLADAWTRFPIALERMDFLENYYRLNGDLALGTITNEQIMREASEFAKNATLTPSRIPGGVKALERLGGTMYGSYMWNVPRVLAMSGFVHPYQSFKMAYEAKTPEARAAANWDGIRKLAGFSGSMLLLNEGLKRAADWMMDDDEREQTELDRAFLLGEAAVGDLVFVNKDEEGHNMYILLSRVDPYGPVNDIVRELRRSNGIGDSWDAIVDGTMELSIKSAMLPHVVKILQHAFGEEKVFYRPSRLERMFPQVTDIAKNAASDAFIAAGLGGDDGSRGYRASQAVLETMSMFVPAGVANRFESINPSPAEMDNKALAESVAILESLGHKFVVARPEAAIRGAANDLRDLHRDSRRQIQQSLRAQGPEAAVHAYARQAQSEREMVSRLGKMYDAAVAKGNSPRAVQEFMKEAGLDSVTIRNISQGLYETENQDWSYKHSAILNKALRDNPPRELTTEERAEWSSKVNEMVQLLEDTGRGEDRKKW